MSVSVSSSDETEEVRRISASSGRAFSPGGSAVDLHD